MIQLRLSYSRARCFDECPAKYKAEYIDAPIGPKTEPPLLIGSVVHECCDRYVKHLMVTKQSSDFEKMLGIFDEVWASEVRGGLSPIYKEDALELCIKARELLVFERIHQVVGSELRIAVDRHWQRVDYDSSQAFVRGRIDRLDIDDDLHARVIDYKSGNKIESLENNYQTPLYAVMVMASYPSVQAVDVSLEYLRHGITKTGRITRADIGRVQKWIESLAVDLAAATTNNEWPARPGMACRGCSAFRTCPARLVSPKLVPPGDESEALIMAERLVLLERETDEIRESLRPWIDQYGALEINGVTLGLFLEKRRKFNTVQVSALLERRGLRPLDFLKVDPTALKKIARQDRRLVDELEACSTDASITKLKLKPTGENE